MYCLAGGLCVVAPRLHGVILTPVIRLSVCLSASLCGNIYCTGLVGRVSTRVRCNWEHNCMSVTVQCNTQLCVCVLVCVAWHPSAAANIHSHLLIKNTLPPKTFRHQLFK